MTERCKCGAFLWGSSRHICPPLWCVQEDGHHDFKDADDHTVVYAHTLDDAAEKYAEQRDEAWSILRSPLELRIWQVDAGVDTAKNVYVTGETTIVYRVRVLDELDGALANLETSKGTPEASAALDSVMTAMTGAALGYGSPPLTGVVPGVEPLLFQQTSPDIHSDILADARHQHALAVDKAFIARTDPTCALCTQRRSSHPTQDQEHGPVCMGLFLNA